MEWWFPKDAVGGRRFWEMMSGLKHLQRHERIQNWRSMWVGGMALRNYSSPLSCFTIFLLGKLRGFSGVLLYLFVTLYGAEHGMGNIGVLNCPCNIFVGVHRIILIDIQVSKRAGLVGTKALCLVLQSNTKPDLLKDYDGQHEKPHDHAGRAVSNSDAPAAPFVSRNHVHVEDF